jgi:hypothetical protein
MPSQSTQTPSPSQNGVPGSVQSSSSSHTGSPVVSLVGPDSVASSDVGPPELSVPGVVDMVPEEDTVVSAALVSVPVAS